MKRALDESHTTDDESGLVKWLQKSGFWDVVQHNLVFRMDPHTLYKFLASLAIDQRASVLRRSDEFWMRYFHFRYGTMEFEKMQSFKQNYPRARWMLACFVMHILQTGCGRLEGTVETGGAQIRISSTFEKYRLLNEIFHFTRYHFEITVPAGIQIRSFFRFSGSGRITQYKYQEIPTNRGTIKCQFVIDDEISMKHILFEFLMRGYHLLADNERFSNNPLIRVTSLCVSCSEPAHFRDLNTQYVYCSQPCALLSYQTR